MKAINPSSDESSRLKELISEELSLDKALEKSNGLSEQSKIKLIQARQIIKIEIFDFIFSNQLQIIRSYKKTNNCHGDN